MPPPHQHHGSRSYPRRGHSTSNGGGHYGDQHVAPPPQYDRSYQDYMPGPPPPSHMQGPPPHMAREGSQPHMHPGVPPPPPPGLPPHMDDSMHHSFEPPPQRVSQRENHRDNHHLLELQRSNRALWEENQMLKHGPPPPMPPPSVAIGLPPAAAHATFPPPGPGNQPQQPLSVSVGHKGQGSASPNDMSSPTAMSASTSSVPNGNASSNGNGRGSNAATLAQIQRELAEKTSLLERYRKKTRHMNLGVEPNPNSSTPMPPSPGPGAKVPLQRARASLGSPSGSFNRDSQETHREGIAAAGRAMMSRSSLPTDGEDEDDMESEMADIGVQHGAAMCDAFCQTDPMPGPSPLSPPSPQSIARPSGNTPTKPAADPVSVSSAPSNNSTASAPAAPCDAAEETPKNSTEPIKQTVSSEEPQPLSSFVDPTANTVAEAVFASQQVLDAVNKLPLSRDIRVNLYVNSSAAVPNLPNGSFAMPMGPIMSNGSFDPPTAAPILQKGASWADEPSDVMMAPSCSNNGGATAPMGGGGGMGSSPRGSPNSIIRADLNGRPSTAAHSPTTPSSPNRSMGSVPAVGCNGGAPPGPRGTRNRPRPNTTTMAPTNGSRGATL